jgi:hypothetical protein
MEVVTYCSDRARGWRTYLLGVHDEPGRRGDCRRLLPECAAREFDD